MSSMTANSTLNARSAERYATANSTAKAARSTGRAGAPGNSHWKPSRNPNTYIATPSGRVRYSAMPMAPPTSSPMDRVRMA